jgi:PAS domain S-box-containing protein
VHEAGRWIYANRAAVAMFGASSPEEIVGRLALDFVAGAQRDEVRARIRNAIGGAPNDAMEQRMIRVDGTEFWADVTGVPSVTLKGTPAVLITARDVSARRTMDERFRSTFEQSAVGLAHVALDGRWVRVNERLCAMLGYDRAELEQLTFRDVMHPDDLKFDELAIGKLLDGETRTYASEKRYQGKEGAVVWANVTISLVRREDGAPDYFIAVAEHIDARKAAEALLVASEARFRHLVEDGADLILVVDAHGIAQFASHNVVHHLGFTAEELMGRPLFDFDHPDDADMVRAAIEDVVTRPGGRIEVASRVLHKDGSWRVLDWSAVNRLDDPVVSGIVINGRDVTDRNRISAELEQLKRVESLGRVAAAVAHEMNNVLMSFQAAAMLAQRNGLDDAFHATLKRALLRGKSVTNDILRYAQPALVMKERVAVTEWLADIVREASAITGDQHPIRLLLDEQLGSVRIDRSQMTQVLLNLIVNARDAMRGGGEITIEARHSHERSGEIAISVGDRGTGIPAELRERIFEPLFTTKPSGTGLGLAIVQQIVLRHGGLISVDSEEGEGTKFVAALPAA